MGRTLLRLLIATAAGLLAVAGLAGPARAIDPTNLGGIDVNAYCLAAGYPGGAKMINSSASGWKCVDANQGQHGLSMTAACRYQFADLVGAGHLVWDHRGGGATGWRCRTWSGYVDGNDLDIARYCQALGYDGARGNPQNVADWYCQRGSTTDRVTLHAACRWQNPVEVGYGRIVVATYEDWGSPYGINCFAF
ncbi:hypothetical protein AB0M02_26745 [Actinoplanes sp. NPDC051861]|uniref:hypothetical protein n=1 Tax=Actinoplanes sp. NPDC051861 TaxID=3155170 RepID=UPI00341DC63D